jgi:hypothetical protein
MMQPEKEHRPTQPSAKLYLGRAQLSLLEHSLCPLDTATALKNGLQHFVSYSYCDKHRHVKQAKVQVMAAQGLSPADEFTLWGLLSLTLSRPEPQPEFMATPHYCLKMLGIIQPGQAKGGKQYQQFRETMRRLARVVYENSAFYDPIRGEHREVAFGLLKYSLPIESASSRAWRIYWDNQFFEYCLAAKSTLKFDLELYRQLDFASRRLFLLLQKIFWRNERSPAFDLRTLAINTLGFSATLETTDLAKKVLHCATNLQAHAVIDLPTGKLSLKNLCTKIAPGKYLLSFQRGAYFEKAFNSHQEKQLDSPVWEPLRAIGLEEQAIRRVMNSYPEKILAEWADITLAARERHGVTFFKQSAAAYFMDNIQAAAAGKRTAPESRNYAQQQSEDQAFQTYLATEAREAFKRIMQRLFSDLQSRGVSYSEAQERAEYIARHNMLSRFRKEHPEYRTDTFF